MKIKKTLMALGASALFLMPAASAHAADTAASKEIQAPATAADVTDEKLEAFAEVHQEVETVNAEYQAKIAATADVNKKNVLAAEANKEMVKIVEASDLNIREYNRIAELVQQDIGLQSKYKEILKD